MMGIKAEISPCDVSCLLSDPRPSEMSQTHGLSKEGPLAKQSGTLHLPRQRRCRLLGIWAGTGLRVKSPTGSEDESDTTLLCCTLL